MRRLVLSTTALSALIALPLHAQDTAVDLGTLVLSGSLSPVPASETGSTVEILEGAALQSDAALARTLSRQPGVSISANGGLGATTNLRIRGLNRNYVGIRFDGIDIADPSGPQVLFDFGGLTGAGLSRVEILKGSQSALYGSEAIAGVVNLTSWRPLGDGPSGQLNVEGGSFGTFIGSASVGAASERGEVAVTFGRVTTEGISARAGDDEEDGFDETSAVISGRYQATDILAVGLNAFWRDSEIEIDRSTFDNSGENSNRQIGWRVFGELVTGPALHTLSYAEFNILREDPGGFTTRFDGSRSELSYLAAIDLGATLDADIGVNRTVEEVETSALEETDETNTAFFGELRWRPSDAATVSLALRSDDNSDFGQATTGRIGLAYDLRDDLILRASAGTGYRAPSLFERFSGFGDPNLDPENSVSYDLGVEKLFGTRGFVRATLFYIEIDDLIDFDLAADVCGSGFGCFGQVPGTTVTQGVELSGAYDVTDAVTLTGAYTYTEAETEEERLPLVPRHDLALGLQAGFADRWTGSAELLHVADIMPSAFAPEDNLVDDYTLVNLGLAYQAWDTGELYLRVENAFDEEYETVGGFNQPGQAIHVGLRATF